MTPQAKIKYATLSVPRYTSYPTAPHFDIAVTPDDVGTWLAEIAEAEPVSLYLHVPYCREICLYCGCHTKATRRDGPLFDYAEGLVEEIKLIGAAIGQGRRDVEDSSATDSDVIKPVHRRQPVSHIHWGGGTPSLLPRQALLDVMAAIGRYFDLLPDAEHAIELDPRSVTADLAATLVEIGINRVSLGVQDISADVQVAIGRVQPLEVIATAVSHLRQAGITGINFDLMYGLPHQTVEGIIATVNETVALSPTRIALFGYAHVPWFKKHQRLIDEAALPGTQDRLDLEVAARGALNAAGYRAVGLDHFALDNDAISQALDAGQLHRNFQGYTTDGAAQLIGIGVSAISRLGGGFAQNALDVSRWRQMVASGTLPIVKGKAFSADDRLRGDVIEQLMCQYHVDLDAVCAHHGALMKSIVDSLVSVRALMADGLVTINGHRIAMTEDGRPFVRVVAAAFDAYLPQNAARHSAAV